MQNLKTSFKSPSVRRSRPEARDTQVPEGHKAPHRLVVLAEHRPSHCPHVTLVPEDTVDDGVDLVRVHPQHEMSMLQLATHKLLHILEVLLSFGLR